MSARLTRVKFRLGEIFGRPPRLKAGLKNSEVAQRRLLPHEHPACRRREPWVRSDYCRRLTANLNSSYSPAVVARHDAMLDEVAIAAPFRIVAAEAGRVAAHAGASGHHRWLNQADSANMATIVFRIALHSILSPQRKQHFRGGIIRRSNIVRGKLTVSRQSRLPILDIEPTDGL